VEPKNEAAPAIGGMEQDVPSWGRFSFPIQFQVTFDIRRVRRNWQIPSPDKSATYGDRNKAIIERYDEGRTLAEIAAEFDIFLQSVHQIVRSQGL
jgi:hypothetical protein